jgi:enamine deaminase RidA (YjgF/YER057c/UK114 family)
MQTEKLSRRGDVIGQTRKAFENMAACLHAAGMEFADVVRVTGFLVDVNYGVAINPVRR